MIPTSPHFAYYLVTLPGERAKWASRFMHGSSPSSSENNTVLWLRIVLPNEIEGWLIFGLWRKDEGASFSPRCSQEKEQVKMMIFKLYSPFRSTDLIRPQPGVDTDIVGVGDALSVQRQMRSAVSWKGIGINVYSIIILERIVSSRPFCSARSRSLGSQSIDHISVQTKIQNMGVSKARSGFIDPSFLIENSTSHI